VSELPQLVKSNSILNDGLDKYPKPLLSDPQDLARQLSDDPVAVQQLTADGIGPPPDGGKDAWFCVAGAFCAIFCLFGFSKSAAGGTGNGADGRHIVWSTAGVLPRWTAERLHRLASRVSS
jgi:hypothetical protein